ncbi:SRPBCC family protein [Stackebrandtia soli]|uniref:SRPBCC family protein n=1 Tax=Stackebrandtia soli TaxID=1892856 RepID=UPI0039E95E51
MTSQVITSLQGDMVHALVTLDGVSATTAMNAWTDPELLKRWWAAGRLTIDPRPGGVYQVYFGMGDQTMNGTIRHFDPSGTLVFDWAWAHEPDAAPTVVTVDITDTETGCVLRLTHGPYTEHDEPERGDMLEGWAAFLKRLAALLTGA